MRTYTIEVRLDFKDATKYAAFLTAARTHTRELLALAMLLKDGRDPQVALSDGDMFEKNEDIDIMVEDGGE